MIMIHSLVFIFFVGSGALNESHTLTPRGGFKLEPVLGYLINDAVEENKSVGGLRASFFYRDMSDASIALETEGLVVTTWTGGGKTPEHDILFQFGPAVYEFYEPWAFRVGGGMTTELNDGETSLGAYYRGALGYYWIKSFGVFAEASGIILFRSAKLSLPVQLATTLQLAF